jgi:hypothetical protein
VSNHQTLAFTEMGDRTEAGFAFALVQLTDRIAEQLSRPSCKVIKARGRSAMTRNE